MLPTQRDPLQALHQEPAQHIAAEQTPADVAPLPTRATWRVVVVGAVSCQRPTAGSAGPAAREPHPVAGGGTRGSLQLDAACYYCHRSGPPGLGDPRPGPPGIRGGSDCDPGHHRLDATQRIPRRCAHCADALRRHRLEAFALRRARSLLQRWPNALPGGRISGRAISLITIPAKQSRSAWRWSSSQGRLIPVDGLVTKGPPSVSEADLTGEPIPANKAAGQICYAGSVNLDSALEAVRPVAAPTASTTQIVRLVELEAQQHKASHPSPG